MDVNQPALGKGFVPGNSTASEVYLSINQRINHHGEVSSCVKLSHVTNTTTAVLSLAFVQAAADGQD